MNILSPKRLIQNTCLNVFDSITMLDFITNNALDFNSFNTIYFLLPLLSNEQENAFSYDDSITQIPNSPKIMKTAFLVHISQGWKYYTPHSHTIAEIQTIWI